MRTKIMKMLIAVYRGGIRRCPYCGYSGRFPDSGECPSCGEVS